MYNYIVVVLEMHSCLVSYHCDPEFLSEKYIQNIEFVGVSTGC